MEASPSAPVSNRAWIELLHAEACWALEQAGVDVLVVKGPTLMDWLYPEGGRESADVDLLVRPEHWAGAVQVLTGRGFGETYAGTREGETAEHSLDLQRHDPELGGHGVDLHRYFPGIDLDPARAFDVLWGRRERGAQAGVGVWYPDVVARALVAGLHAARDPGSAKAAEDLRRALVALDAGRAAGAAELAGHAPGRLAAGAALAAPEARQLAELAALAALLRARVALRAGLETHAESASYVERLGLGDVEVSAYWELMSHSSGRLAARMDQWQRRPWRARPALVWRWLFPTPALMRVRDPGASRGRVGLGVAYVRRLGDGVRLVPGAVRDLRAARHRRP